MKVKEVEELLLITRANIRFYEKEGLLNPERSENGYRSYSKEDVEKLKKIILFRKLGISIPDIKKIFDNEETIAETISRNIISLNRQMDEIKGAIDVCKMMEKDASIDLAFDTEKYWNIVEQEELSGNAFFDNLKDYIEFESNTFKSIWKRDFSYDLDTSIKKRGWISTLLIILGICVIRGLTYKFVWKFGNFWYGFSYPFVMFIIISCITLPMYILNKKYSDKEVLEEEQKKIQLFGLWRVIIVTLYLIMVLVGIPIFLEKIIYNNVMERGENYIITGSPFILYIIVALYLFSLIIWLYSNQGLFGKEGVKSHIPEPVKKKVLAVSVCIFIITVVVYGTWNNCITKKGITERHLFWTKTYSFEYVNYYTLSAKFDGTLNYTIILKDGTPISLLGDSSFSNLDKNEYPKGQDDFVLQLTKQFVNKGVSIKVNSWEKLHKNLTIDYWDKYAEEIRAIAEK